MTGNTFSTPGVLALRLGVQVHHLVRLLKRGQIPFARAGRLHLIAESDVELARAALRVAGYLRDQPEAVAHAG